MTANTLLVTLLPTVVTFLVTSGVWVGVFFAVGLNQPSSTSNYYYGSDTSALPPPIPTYPPAESCPAAGTYSMCSVDCEFQICESVPDDLYDTDRGTWSTTKCWLRLIESAEHEIVMGTYYWTLLAAETDKDCKDKEKCAKWSDEGKQVYDALVAAARRGIAIRIAVNTPDPNGNGFAKEHTLIEPMAIRDVNPEKVQVRSVNFTRIIGGGGILHTKSFTVDGKHGYTGSANFDWRSLTQTKEIGVATFNCACIAEDLQRILESYWYMGAEDAVLPAAWPAEYTTNAGHDRPYNVPRTEGPATAIHFSTAPPQFNACGRDNDIDNMIQMIDEAEDYLFMAVMDYAPTSLFEGKTTPNIYYERLDAAIKRAAFERFVDVKFMMSKWIHENPKLYTYIHEFDDFNDNLPCKPGVTPCKSGSIEARLYNLPEDGWEGVPFVRYQHTKYFISERAAFIGTSNWAADYWINTAGISIAIRSADHGGTEQLVEQVKRVYLEDWNSPYAIPISKFSLNGTRIEE